jgi:hypothetical protein
VPDCHLIVVGLLPTSQAQLHTIIVDVGGAQVDSQRVCASDSHAGDAQLLPACSHHSTQMLFACCSAPRASPTAAAVLGAAANAAARSTSSRRSAAAVLRQQ